MIEGIVIAFLFKRLHEALEDKVEIMRAFSKEANESQAITAQAISTNTAALQLNTEVLRQVAK